MKKDIDNLSDYELDLHFSGGPILHQTKQNLLDYINSEKRFLELIEEMCKDNVDKEFKDWMIQMHNKTMQDIKDELARREKKKEKESKIIKNLRSLL